jgi:hypothetical protein
LLLYILYKQDNLDDVTWGDMTWREMNVTWPGVDINFSISNILNAALE